MLANLNRATHFNVLVYQGKRLIAFRDELVPGLPSNLRYAIEWLEPLNRDYQQLGLPRSYGESLLVSDHEELPLQAADVSHYTKAIQKAMEWQASAIFCITQRLWANAAQSHSEDEGGIDEKPSATGNARDDKSRGEKSMGQCCGEDTRVVAEKKMQPAARRGYRRR